jgi:hypothetical protein
MPPYEKRVPYGFIKGEMPDYPGEAAHAEQLVVDEDQTDQGIGGQLLNAFEVEAIFFCYNFSCLQNFQKQKF